MMPSLSVCENICHSREKLRDWNLWCSHNKDTVSYCEKTHFKCRPGHGSPRFFRGNKMFSSLKIFHPSFPTTTMNNLFSNNFCQTFHIYMEVTHRLLSFMWCHTIIFFHDCEWSVKEVWAYTAATNRKGQICQVVNELNISSVKKFYISKQAL